MIVLNHKIRDRAFICQMVVTCVDEDVVEDICFDRLQMAYPTSVIRCLDIDYDIDEQYKNCNVYHLKFLVEEEWN